ncbi:MAG: hypothetical protein H7Y31_00035 [Chitinophagaceae bacterium]|nr:hypothetical protein [Chitinophagaceae bacterium]
MKTLLFLLFSLMSVSAISQDVTGIWRGYFNQVDYVRDAEGNKTKVTRERYKLEVQLDQRDNRFNGVTYSYLTTVFYGKASAAGTVNQKTKKILLDELKIVEVRMSGLSDACIMTFFLQYAKSGDEEFLEGTYTSMNTRDSTSCGRGTVFLRRVVTSDFYKEPFLVTREKEIEDAKKNETKIGVRVDPTVKKVVTTPPVTKKTPTTKPPVTNNTAKTGQQKKINPPPVTEKKIAKADPVPSKDIKLATVDTPKKTERKITPSVIPRVLATRENEVVKTIITNSKEIIINVYDNGAIDNDTVSVYLDKKLVLSKQRLTGKALQVKFQLDETNDYHELVMVAENLGEIPPNTSLMVVNAGNKQYEVRITSNEQKNAVVIFKYEKD